VNFDDHEIWGAPVRASEAAQDATASDTPQAPATGMAGAGRLYRSAGSDPHPEAILALPNHRRHTTAQPLEAAPWAAPATSIAPAAPITINSRIPHPGTIEDAALAEIVGAPSALSETAGFTSWFKSPHPLEAIAALRQTNTGIATPEVVPNTGALGMPIEFGGGHLNARAFAAFVFVVTAVVGVANAAVSTNLGVPTGIALAVATTFGAWRIDATARWAAWVMPSYALIAAILVAGQFTASAPGASPLGQVLLVTASLITLAPWLAAASLIGAVLPALRGRTA